MADYIISAMMYWLNLNVFIKYLIVLAIVFLAVRLFNGIIGRYDNLYIEK